MKLLIVAGGGGHFAAALAVIEQLPKDWEVMVVGRKYVFEGDKTLSFEYQTASRLGLRFETITTGRLQRNLTKHSLISLAKVPVGLVQSLKLLKDYKPDVVLSFGGYVSVPVGLAAKALGISVIVHEQIMHAGLANKIVAKFAKKVCISWPQSAKYFPKEKVVLTGNPIKQLKGAKFVIQNFNAKFPVVYITGGSGGAHALNALIEGCLENLLEKYTLVHQTGSAKMYGDFERLTKKKHSLSPELQKRYQVLRFVEPDEVLSLFEQADLVVSRSGINTVTELLSLGKPCLLIPLPYGQRNEQLTNALFVKEKGIAEVLQQPGLTPETLFEKITEMMKSLRTYTAQSQKAKEAVILDAANQIIALVAHGYEQTKSAKS
jgi:UDP-N-acetylglucosamine--N-acetylmuramyl-(pentapeptide) pyrophosphoryl-undecaprenol N-acetylglucosamine transferase